MLARLKPGGSSGEGNRHAAGRRGRTAAAVILTGMLAFALTGCGMNQSSVFHTQSVEQAAAPERGTVRVPWDYKIVEGTVGDLIGSDMTVLPDNQLMPNDGNYATGDAVWSLQFMDADITADENNRNDIRLSSWDTIKTFKSEKEAKEDMGKLKLSLTTELDLIGVYKTEFEGKTRNFAVVELPSGNRIKQPIDDKRYEAFTKLKKVKAKLEEIHDFAEYDLAYAKFRGWAD
ncbi:signal peptide protein [Paenibacillus sp. NPDC058071]|uniref:signal peptide protein n=1 Tax=Paenibacillus sp. NPDC058071 TaxID=3346326 RepID=UPI0036DE3F31